MGAGSVLGKDKINKVIKGFSRLVAATEKEPHPGRSNAHPARPPSLTGLLHQALGTAVHRDLLLAAAVAEELSNAPVQWDCSFGFLAICFPIRKVMCMLVMLPRIPSEVLLFYLTRSPVCRRAGH